VKTAKSCRGTVHKQDVGPCFRWILPFDVLWPAEQHPSYESATRLEQSSADSTNLLNMDMSGLDDLEELRQTLETNITKLRKALTYWRTWEAEHEGLKEELEELEGDASAEDMYDVGASIRGDVVTEKGRSTTIT
jgi:hypothetical protein